MSEISPEIEKSPEELSLLDENYSTIQSFLSIHNEEQETVEILVKTEIIFIKMKCKIFIHSSIHYVDV